MSLCLHSCSCVLRSFSDESLLISQDYYSTMQHCRDSHVYRGSIQLRTWLSTNYFCSVHKSRSVVWARRVYPSMCWTWLRCTRNRGKFPDLNLTETLIPRLEFWGPFRKWSLPPALYPETFGKSPLNIFVNIFQYSCRGLTHFVIYKQRSSEHRSQYVDVGSTQSRSTN